MASAFGHRYPTSLQAFQGLEPRQHIVATMRRSANRILWVAEAVDCVRGYDFSLSSLVVHEKLPDYTWSILSSALASINL